MEFVDKFFGLETKVFSLSEPKYDNSKFLGRWRHFIEMINPVSLMYTAKEAQNAKDLLDDYKSGNLKTPVSDEKLWKARWLVESTYHPDTQQPINKLFRFSCFIPVNIPIMIGMLLSPKNAFSIPFWQAVNQTYNVGFNYSNRNINNPFTNTQLAVSYLIATSSSVVLAMGLDKVITKYAGNSLFLRTLGPATAVAIAGCANLLVVRYRELSEGVMVHDDQGNPLGRSKLAAKDGLLKTTAIRFFMQYPLCFAPVVLASGLKGLGMYPAGGPGRLLAQVLCMSANLFIVLPACFAAFPQIIRTDKLEEDLVSPNGFSYNRGL